MLKDKRELQLISDNGFYEPYNLPFNQIAELWQYKAHIGFQDMKQSVETYVDDRISDIQQKVKAVSYTHLDVYKRQTYKRLF